MKRFALAPLILMLLILVGCTGFEKNAYVSLESAQTVWETGMGVAADLKVEGKVTDEQWLQIYMISNKISAGGALCSELMATYSKVAAIQDAGSPQELDAKQAAVDAIKDLFGKVGLLVDKVEVLSGKKLPVSLNLLI
jgi:hypothetical protein